MFGSIYIYAKVVKSQTKKLTFYGFLSDDDIFRYDDVMQILVPMTFLIVFSLFCRLRAKKVYSYRLCKTQTFFQFDFYWTSIWTCKIVFFKEIIFSRGRTGSRKEWIRFMEKDPIINDIIAWINFFFLFLIKDSTRESLWHSLLLLKVQFLQYFLTLFEITLSRRKEDGSYFFNRIL